MPVYMGDLYGCQLMIFTVIFTVLFTGVNWRSL